MSKYKHGGETSREFSARLRRDRMRSETAHKWNSFTKLSSCGLDYIKVKQGKGANATHDFIIFKSLCGERVNCVSCINAEISKIVKGFKQDTIDHLKDLKAIYAGLNVKPKLSTVKIDKVIDSVRSISSTAAVKSGTRKAVKKAEKKPVKKSTKKSITRSTKTGSKNKGRGKRNGK